MWKKCVCLLVAGLFAVGLLAGVGSAENVELDVKKSPSVPSPKGYTTHAPIRINSDADFTAQFANRTIWGLEIDGTGKGFCLFIGNCSIPFTVKECYLHNASGRNESYFANEGLYIYKSSNGTLKNNNCLVNSLNGIIIIYSKYCIISYNNCSMNSGNGIELTCSNNNTLRNNNCSVNSESGIYLDIATDCTLTKNSCFANSKGIKMVRSSRNTIQDNNCSANIDYGLDFNYSDNNLLTGNNCSANSNTGIALGLSGNNIICYNSITANIQYGVSIGFSWYNRVYHNNFINNNGAGFIYDSSHIQAYDVNGVNFWNNTYLSGGNYWSDWAGPDNDHDSIVDLPYNISGSLKKDYYPLTTQVVVPDVSPTPALIIAVLLLTAITVRRRAT